MSFTRRSFVKTATASGLFLPFVPLQGFAADTDVVIVGAGAAGLAAARQLMKKGKTFKLIEAGNRIGGRAFTDTNTFGVPFDLGCTFQHYAKTNPWVKFAIKNSIPIGKLPEKKDYVKIGRRTASDNEWDMMNAKYKKIYRAIKRAATRGSDISIRDAIQKVPTNDWSPIAEHWFEGGMGADLEKVSVLEWWNRPDGVNFHCPAGYGTLVELYGRDIPVELNTVAKEIEISGNGVSVVTNQGTISAKHCLITVSLGVLESELIKFKPGLSKRKLRAINSLQMANYVTFGLKFERPKIFPSRNMAWFWIVNNQEKLLEYMGNMGEHGIQRATASGDLAIELENLGQEEALEVVKERLGAALPTRKMKLYQDGIMTKWNNNPYFKGTWSLAKPGYYGKRGDLSKTEHKRLHFAGEATHKIKYALCDGALLSGIDAGKKLAKLV